MWTGHSLPEIHKTHMLPLQAEPLALSIF